VGVPLSDHWKDAVEHLIEAAETDKREFVQAVADRIHRSVDLATQAATADPPNPPANLRVTSIEVLSPTRALLYVAWDPVPGATLYRYGHDGPDGAWHRVIATTPDTTAEIGQSLPFVVAPGSPYTWYVQAGVSYGAEELWSDPAVMEVQVPEYVPPEPSTAKPVASVTGQIENDALVVPLLVGKPGGDLSDVSFVVDTGAFECAIDAATAQALGLPNLGPIQVGGVGGSAAAYLTQVDVQFGPGGTVYRSVNAVAIDGFGQNLWGLRFAVDRGYELRLNTRSATLAYYEAD